MQVQGELQSGGPVNHVYRNPIQAFKKIYHTEGVRGLQKGLSAGVLYQFFMNGSRLGLFELLRPYTTTTTVNKSRGMTFLRDLALGCTTGAFGAFIGSPFFLIKCRMQVYSTQNPVGAQHNYKSVFDGFRDLIKTEGWVGLLRGSNGAMLRVAVGSGTQVSVYTGIKEWLISYSIPDGMPLHFASSLVTGLAVTITMNPVDLVASRLYIQHVKSGGTSTMYTGPFDCIQKTLKTEGVMGFYKGFGAHYLRLAPHTILTFIIWEKLKSVFTPR